MPDAITTGQITPELAGGILTIDLNALRNNWLLLQNASRGAICSAVVKADAYGTGQDQAVATLAAAGCQTFFVAHAAEAFRARAAAPDAIIYMLNGLPPGTAQRIAASGVRPVLGSVAEIAEWRRDAGGAPAALHIDTGMSRLGLSATEAAAVASQGIGAGSGGGHDGVCLILSHFVSAEEPDSPLNDVHIARFTEMSRLFPGIAASLANSSGIMLPQQPHFELTRPGYALYGGNPTPGRVNPMHPVVKLECRIIQLRDVDAGATVGYNARWRAPAPSRIAVISLGYADGFSRRASVRNTGEPQPLAGGAAVVAGTLCPMAGMVSMDLIAIDISAVPHDDVVAGDMVTLIGGELDVDVVAQRLGTIGYEVLTSLGHRYARHYIGEAGATP